MISYFEPHFIEKFHWKRCFSNFGHVTISRNENSLFGRHFEMQHFLNVLFADLWLFEVYTDMVQVSYRNSNGKVPKNEWVQVEPPCAQTEVKSSLGTFKVIMNNTHKTILILIVTNTK